jgi:hypothetical protein
MIWQMIGAIGESVTAIGVFVAVYQLVLTKKANQTQFEDDLTKEYREITRTIPLNALLGAELTIEESTKARDGLYFYIDLCNEQVFLRQNGRVCVATWIFWQDGIKSNLARPAFKEAWEVFKLAAPNSFNELRQLEKTDFKDDPASW